MCCILYALLIGCACSNCQPKVSKVEKPCMQNFDCCHSCCQNFDYGRTEENINCPCSGNYNNCNSNLYVWNNLNSNCR